ncbi:MAG: hypothetical protein WEB13_06045 [Dehalococcoidia bacterium]
MTFAPLATVKLSPPSPVTRFVTSFVEVTGIDPAPGIASVR